MSEQLLTVLKLCLLALLYLFFLRVLRAVWSEVNPPRVATAEGATGGRRRFRRRSGAASSTPRSSGRKATAARKAAAAVPSALDILEPANRAGTSVPLGAELTIGRAGGCSLVLDEQYVSQVHCRVFLREGSAFVEDLGSTNGTWVNGTRAVGQMPARPGDRIQVGNVVMGVR